MPEFASFSLGSLVYVRYKDHVIFKNLKESIKEAVERETIGWIQKRTDEIILIEHDRTIQTAKFESNQVNGIVLLNSCIIEIRALPLQKNSNWLLNSSQPTSKGEYALKPKKRKTQH